ncbi:MAG: hypothetical protein R3A79_02045 [Nannocystaceae bacterium]
MPTVDLRRRRAQTPRARLYVEREGLRGGPFAQVLDPDGLLAPAPLRALKAGPDARPLARRGRLTLRAGRIDDPFLRRWLLAHTFCGTPEYLDLWAVDDDGAVIGRWTLGDLRILEIADRRRRDPDDPRFDYIILEGDAQPLDPAD